MSIWNVVNLHKCPADNPRLPDDPTAVYIIALQNYVATVRQALSYTDLCRVATFLGQAPTHLVGVQIEMAQSDPVDWFAHLFANVVPNADYLPNRSETIRRKVARALARGQRPVLTDCTATEIRQAFAEKWLSGDKVDKDWLQDFMAQVNHYSRGECSLRLIKGRQTDPDPDIKGARIALELFYLGQVQTVILKPCAEPIEFQVKARH